jgi:two-component system nitrogen regulation response regulator NtrX
VDVRVISATSALLDEAVHAGRFREDLLYRLDVIRIVVPPLRERREDILPLFHWYLRRLATAHGLEPPELAADFTAALREHEWPGNVRQLVNVVERALLTREGTLTAATLRALLGPRHGAPGPAATTALELDPARPLQDYLDEVERRYLESALRSTGGSLQATAVAAGVSSRTLLRKLKRHGLDRRKYR